MARNSNQWAALDYANIGKSATFFDSKEEAIIFAKKYNEEKDEAKQFLKVDEERKSVYYRGKVYL